MDAPIEITKAEAVDAYGGNQAALARALGVTRQAVSAMAEGPLAERYALKLRYVLKPELFGDECRSLPPPQAGTNGHAANGAH